MKKFNVACFQVCSSEDPKKNISMLSKMFSELSKNVELICLPECVAIFTDSKRKLQYYFNDWHNDFLNFIKEKAKKHSSNILIGSVPFKKKNGKFLNRSYLVDSSGVINNYYDKINLFDVKLSQSEEYMESKNFDSGKNVKVLELPFGKIGLSICYDLRFSSLYKKLASKGADFFSIPAAFTYTTGKAHWHPLIKSRAIENGCFVFAAAQVGFHENGRRTFGHSLIVDPWGKIISDGLGRKGIIYGSVDKKIILESRKKIPSMQSFLKNS